MAINTRQAAVAVAGSNSTPATLSGFRLEKAVGDQERRFFTEQMSLLLETGTPLQASLQAPECSNTTPGDIKME